MNGKIFKKELENFANWFEKREHGDDSYTKIVERYVKEKAEEISEEVHFCWSEPCECKTDLDRTLP